MNVMLEFIRRTFLSSENHWTTKELDQFKHNLGQVIGWTSTLAQDFDYNNGKFGFVFRKTNPIYKGTPLYKFGETYPGHSFDEDSASWNNCNYSYDGYDFLLNEVVQNRSINTNIHLSEIDKLGRILTFETCITTNDGAPIAESMNFVDESDVPPIDTWFFLKRNYLHSDHRCKQTLFCWIPKQFESVMQRAIDVEILDSYRWFDENDSDTYNLVRSKN